MSKILEKKIRSTTERKAKKINEGAFDHRSEFPASVPIQDRLHAIEIFKKTQRIFNKLTYYYNRELLNRVSKLINNSQYFEIVNSTSTEKYFGLKIKLKPEYKNLIKKRTIEIFLDYTTSCQLFLEDREYKKPVFKFYKKGVYEIVRSDFRTYNKTSKIKSLYIKSSQDMKKLGEDYIKVNEQIIKDWIELIDNLNEDDFNKPIYILPYKKENKMNRNQLRKIIQEELNNTKLENTRKRSIKKLNEAKLGNLSRFDFEFDEQTTRNMDCDLTLPHASYEATDDDGNLAQAFLWVEKNGKCWFAITDGDGDDYKEKLYPSMAIALKTMKKTLRLAQVEALVKNTKIIL